MFRAWLGTARPGGAKLGEAWLGKVWQGRGNTALVSRHGLARSGEAGCSGARQGKGSRRTYVQGRAWSDPVRQGLAGTGSAWPDMVGLDRARRSPSYRSSSGSCVGEQGSIP